MVSSALLLLSFGLARASDSPPPSRAIETVARRLLAASKYPGRADVRLHYYAPGLIGFDVDGKPTTGVPTHLKDVSARVYAPRSGRNTLDTAAIVWTPRFYSYARTVDEAAFIMAHEIAHLELGHHRRYHEAFCKMYRQWKKKAVPCVDDAPDFERFSEEMAAPRERLKLLARASEYEADARAVRMVTDAGYDARVYAVLFKRADELWQEKGFVPNELHPEPGDRIRHLEATVMPEVLADQAAW